MNITTEHLRAEVEAVAEATGLSTATIGRHLGQGGRFYKRLCEGKRMWPDTIVKVHHQLQEMRARAACEASHGDNSASSKGEAA